MRLLMAVAALCMAQQLQGSPKWERIGAPAVEQVETDATVQVSVADHAIVLTLTRAAEVKVFTILGQLVADEQLAPGIWRLPMDKRGIYILKTGASTRRITI